MFQHSGQKHDARTDQQRDEDERRDDDQPTAAARFRHGYKRRLRIGCCDRGDANVVVGHGRADVVKLQQRLADADLSAGPQRAFQNFLKFVVTARFDFRAVGRAEIRDGIAAGFALDFSVEIRGYVVFDRDRIAGMAAERHGVGAELNLLAGRGALQHAQNVARAIERFGCARGGGERFAGGGLGRGRGGQFACAFGLQQPREIAAVIHARRERHAVVEFLVFGRRFAGRSGHLRRCIGERFGMGEIAEFQARLADADHVAGSQASRFRNPDAVDARAVGRSEIDNVKCIVPALDSKVLPARLFVHDLNRVRGGAPGDEVFEQFVDAVASGGILKSQRRHLRLQNFGRRWAAVSSSA